MSDSEETTAERLVRELRERYPEGERIRIQFDQGVINPIELANFMGIRPQQVYADIRSARLEGVIDNNTQKKVIPRDAAIAYAARYMDRKAARLLQREQEARAVSEAS